MIKIWIPIVMIMTIGGAQAQISLDQNDFPKAGLDLKMLDIRSSGPNGTYLGDSIDIGSAGNGATYDFSKVLPFDRDSGIIRYFTPAQTGYASEHPASTLARMEAMIADVI